MEIDVSDEGSTHTHSGGISFFGLLGIAFIVMKLMGIITWSWWWVTAPLWGPLAALFAVLVVVLLVAAMIGRKDKSR